MEYNASNNKLLSINAFKILKRKTLGNPIGIQTLSFNLFGVGD